VKNRSAALGKDSLIYVKAYRSLAGSVTGAILFQQLEWRFSKHPDGFFKFLEPTPNNRRYRAGDSWVEELGFSKDEFRTAFDGVGIRYQSKKAFDEAEPRFERADGSEAMYASYVDRFKGLTYYFRNDKLVDRRLEDLAHSIPEKPARVNRESQSTTCIGKPNLPYIGIPDLQQNQQISANGESGGPDARNLSADAPLDSEEERTARVNRESQSTTPWQSQSTVNRESQFAIKESDTTLQNTDTTHTQNGAGSAVCVPKFSYEVCLRFARYLRDTGQGIDKPGAWATVISRSGEQDTQIEQWLATEQATEDPPDLPGDADPKLQARLLENFSAKLNPRSFTQWFADARLTTSEGMISLWVARSEQRQMILSTYADVLCEAVEELGLSAIEVRVIGGHK
jgi:hypothetical protein